MDRPFRAVASLGLAAIATACSSKAPTVPEPLLPSTQPTLEATLERRFVGDRTGACVAAAVIDASVDLAFVCANPDLERRLAGETPLEIGSITKTMTGFLLADAVARGLLQLDDPLARHLPDGTRVPEHGDAPIRLRHLVTHTSGLPRLPTRLTVADPANPYAALTEAELLGSLADVDLEQAPGQRWEYSNFGYLLLSYVVARAQGGSPESLLDARLFQPLGMRHSFIASPPPGVTLAQGHLSTGDTTSAWDFPSDLAGVGGVRASLQDMVLYAQAALGRGDADVVRLLRETLSPVPSAHGAPEMGLGWLMAHVGGKTLATHEGGTDGFSSFIALDVERGRGVVLLLDTSFVNLAGVQELALYLLAPETSELHEPRLVAQPEEELLSALAGDYRLDDLSITLKRDGGSLFVRADNQPEFELGYDSYGDFYTLAFDALLTPVRLTDGSYTFRWAQGGASQRAERVR